MQITLYRSFLCPRCYLAKKYLLEIAQQKEDITITEVDIMNHPLKTWQDGIRIIPALKCGDTTLSGVFLYKEQIINFIEQLQSSVNK